jgi:hypothetical protein
LPFKHIVGLGSDLALPWPSPWPCPRGAFTYAGRYKWLGLVLGRALGVPLHMREDTNGLAVPRALRVPWLVLGRALRVPWRKSPLLRKNMSNAGTWVASLKAYIGGGDG